MLRLEIAEAILVLQCKWGELLSVPQGERFAYSLPTKGYNRAPGQPNPSDRTGGRFKNYNTCFSPCQEEINFAIPSEISTAQRRVRIHFSEALCFEVFPNNLLRSNRFKKR
jgi:hypothetical protein